MSPYIESPQKQTEFSLRLYLIKSFNPKSTAPHSIAQKWTELLPLKHKPIDLTSHKLKHIQSYERYYFDLIRFTESKPNFDKWKEKNKK